MARIRAWGGREWRQRQRRSLLSSLDKRLVLRLIRESFRQHVLAYSIAVVAMVIVAATTALSAWIMRDITNQFLDSSNMEMISILAASVAAIFIVKGLANYVQARFLSYAGNSIIADRQRKIFDRMLQHGIEFYHSYNSADLITRLTQSAAAARSVIDLLVTSFVRDLLSLAGLIAVMVIQQPVMSLFALIVGPAAIVSVNLLLKRARQLMEMEFLSIAQIVQVLQETIFGVRIVKSFGLEDTMRKQMNRAISDVQTRANGIASLEAITSPIMETLAGLAIAGVILVSGYLVTRGGQTPGEIMSFITALLLAYEPAKRLARTRVALESGLVGVRMMYELADRPILTTERRNAAPLPAGRGHIRFDNVDFCYRDNDTVLDRLTLDFAPGCMTALVGASGAGKSTIVNLIMRLYDPIAGRVMIDGTDIRDVSLASLRERISYVSQETFLFSGSVMHNIRLGRHDASDADVIDAAKAANAHEFIVGLPQGYETPVGENGLFLSGGQRQRLSIARAMLRQSQILLLDEATSALDAESEALFRDALTNLRVGSTTIVIAHRLSTVHLADKIIVLGAGKLMEEGSHATLLETGGMYRKLYDYQLIR